MLAIINEHGGRRPQAKVYMQQQQQTCCMHGSSPRQKSKIKILLRICEGLKQDITEELRLSSN